MSNLTKKRVLVEVESTGPMDSIIEFFRSKAGHGLIVLLSCFVLVALTAFLFADTLESIRGWKVAGIALGVLFAVVFEVSTFFLAINGYSAASWVAACFSVVIARATFAQMFPGVEFSNLYVASWIMSVFPPLIVAYTSHKLSKKYNLETLARTAEQTGAAEGKALRSKNGIAVS